MKNQHKYTQDCLRTWKRPNVFALDIKTENEETANLVNLASEYEELAHICMGLSGEVLSELEFAFAVRNAKNIKEEIGDIQYFILLAANRYNVDLTHLGADSMLHFNDSQVAKFCLSSPFKAVKYFMGEFIDNLKKVKIYQSNKVTMTEVAQSLCALQSSLHKLSARNGFTAEEAIEAVIAKLRERFPDKFSAEASDNRNTKAEEAVL